MLGILLEFIAPSRTTLIADSSALTIRRKGLLRIGTTRVSAERVREASAEGCSVSVIWDDGRWTYANRTLGEDGAAWVRDAVRSALE